MKYVMYCVFLVLVLVSGAMEVRTHFALLLGVLSLSPLNINSETD